MLRDELTANLVVEYGSTFDLAAYLDCAGADWSPLFQDGPEHFILRNLSIAT